MATIEALVTLLIKKNQTEYLEKDVFGKINPVGRDEFTAAGQKGFKASMMVEVWGFEYENQTEINGYLPNIRTKEQRQSGTLRRGKGGERLRASIDNLDEAIKAELENWSNDVVKRAANEAFEETAAAAAKSLRQGGPYQERTGRYTKDWTYDQRSGRTSVITGLNGYSVYNKKNYQLTHLLEKGHQLRRGGRTYGNVKAFEHIAPVNETLGDLAVSKITQKVRG